ADFPVLSVIRPTLLRHFREGRRRVSPVAQRVLVTVLPLSPRRNGVPRQPVCGTPCCLHPILAGFGFRGVKFSRPPLRLLALRPGDSVVFLTVTFGDGV